MANRKRESIMNRNTDLNTLLPKLATIISLLAIGFNLVLHVICTDSLLSFGWRWTLMGLLPQAILVFFAKICQKTIKIRNDESERKGFCACEWRSFFAILIR